MKKTPTGGSSSYNRLDELDDTSDEFVDTSVELVVSFIEVD
jgi:hypothetical protein